MNRISDRIREVRKTLHLSQADLAKRLGVTRGHISNLETGQAAPSEQLLRLVSELFLVNFEWLSHGTGVRFYAIARSVQEEFFRDISFQLDQFLAISTTIASWPAKTLKRYSGDELSPDLCPPQLLENMRKILKIPDGELFQLVRERFLAWGGVLEEPEKE